MARNYPTDSRQSRLVGRIYGLAKYSTARILGGLMNLVPLVIQARGQELDNPGTARIHPASDGGAPLGALKTADVCPREK